eukprot:scaffold1923_cov235-Ochromonas_danica.AAC.3
MDEVQQLREQVAQRDEIISTMKQRTKDFIAKLKSDHQMEIEKQRETLSKDFEEKIVALERKVASTKEAAKQQTDQLTEMQRLLTDCQQRSAELESSLSSQLQRKEQEWREEVIQLKAQIAQREQGMATLQKDLSEKQEKVFSLDFQLVELRSLHDTAKKVVQPPSADSALESLTVENLNAELSTLQAAKEKLEDELSTLLTTISQKDDALQAAFAEVNQVKQRAAETEETLLQELANLQDEVAKLTSEVKSSTSASDIEQLQTILSAKEQELSTTHAKTSSLISDMEEQLAGLRSALSAKEQEVLSLQEQVSSLDPAKTGLEEEVAGLRSALSAKEQKVLSSQEQVSSLDPAKTGLEEEVAGLRSALSAKEQEVLSLQEQVSSLDPAKTGLEEEVAGLRSALSAKERELSALQIQAETLGKQFGEAET